MRMLFNSEKVNLAKHEFEYEKLRVAVAKNEITEDTLALYKKLNLSYERVFTNLVRYGGDIFPLQHRDWLVVHYAWAIPNIEAVDYIATLSHTHPICEIGAGNGYWAYRIKRAGGTITAYEAHLWHQDTSSPGIGFALGIPVPEKFWYPVKHVRAADIDVPPDNALFLCWPDLDATWPTELLQRFEGEHLIYIGEPEGGCCADDTFFEELYDNWTEEHVIEIPKYYTIKDKLFHYRRNTE